MMKSDRSKKSGRLQGNKIHVGQLAIITEVFHFLFVRYMIMQ